MSSSIEVSMSMQIPRFRLNVITVLIISMLLAGNCKKKVMIKIENNRVTETLPGNRVSAAYLNILNTSDKDDVLLSVDSEDFELVEFHNMYEDNGVMKMEPMDFVTVKAGDSVKFAPGGMHIMLINNRREIKAGETIKLQLHFENAGLVNITSPVKSIQEQVE